MLFRSLLFYGNAKKKQLENDPYRLEIPNYTCSCEKRGLVVGVSGTGKTNFIYSQIVDWSKSGKSYIVTDIKPEIWGTLHANGIIEGFEYDDIVINPTDPNSPKYNLLDDVDDSELGEIVKILVPTVSDETQGFALTAQKLLRGVILHLKAEKGAVSLPAVYSYISGFKGGNKLIERIIDEGEDVPAKLMRQARLAGDNERFMSSSISALLSALELHSSYPSASVVEIVSVPSYSLAVITEMVSATTYPPAATTDIASATTHSLAATTDILSATAYPPAAIAEMLTTPSDCPADCSGSLATCFGSSALPVYWQNTPYSA
mgnify:CR=1 FL=1